MSGVSLRTIQKGFETRLDALAKSMSPRRPIAWENINFTPPAKGGWWQTSFQPEMPVGVGLGQLGTKHYFGIFHINVFQEKSGGIGGPALANDDASAILQQFPIGGSFVHTAINIHIVSSGRSAGNTDDSWYYIPVRINWQTWIDEEG